MKKIIFLGLMLASSVSFGQIFKTGDAELDASLKVVNTDANKDLPTFKLDLSKRFNVGLPKVEACFKVGMAPSDAFMALQVADLTRRPVEDVITVYKKSKSKGWGAMAKEMGIKPGSPEFHALKGKVKEKSKGNGKATDAKDKPAGNGNSKKESSGDKGGNGKSNGNGNSGKSNGNGNGKGKK